MPTQLTRTEILDMFCDDLNKTGSLLIKTSFRKFADFRDNLAQTYSKLSGIPEEEFYQHEARRIALEMIKLQGIYD